MLPKSLRNTHPLYCKGQPRETLPVNKQKASYGSKVEQKLRKEIEEEMKAKYSKVEQTVETKPEANPSVPSVPVRMEREASRCIREREPPKQLTAKKLLQQHYNEIRRVKREEQMQKINRFKSSMF